MKEPVPVTALWLRKIGDQVQMLAEVDGRWRLIWEEFEEGPFSAICEARAFREKPYDRFSAGH
jgi:hypothetical protein